MSSSIRPARPDAPVLSALPPAEPESDAGESMPRSSRKLGHRDRAELLWAVHVDRVRPRRGGVRGMVTAPMKGFLRPFLRWYVGPLVDRQRDFNDVTLKLIDELGEALHTSLDTRLLKELEERVLRLERAARAALPASHPARVASPNPPPSTPIDYFTFEARMRGSRADVLARQQPYIAHFQNAAPVLDIGCGRGEFLCLLRDAGIEAVGVDRDLDMVEFCRAERLSVEQGDAIAYLEALADESLGGVFAAQVLEHIPPTPLVRLLELAAAKLRPGGILVAETMNPLSLVALKNYFADLTHAQPLVPETLALLARQAGFSSTELRFVNEPPESERLRPVDLPPNPAFDNARLALDANVARLNEVVFGPQDYALIARRGRAA
jgi:SAM-dependent methyltransferase